MGAGQNGYSSALPLQDVHGVNASSSGAERSRLAAILESRHGQHDYYPESGFMSFHTTASRSISATGRAMVNCRAVNCGLRLRWPAQASPNRPTGAPRSGGCNCHRRPISSTFLSGWKHFRTWVATGRRGQATRYRLSEQAIADGVVLLLRPPKKEAKKVRHTSLA